MGSSTHAWTHKTIPCAPSPLCHFVELIAGGWWVGEGKKEEVGDMEERDGVRKAVCESLIISSLIGFVSILSLCLCLPFFLHVNPFSIYILSFSLLLLFSPVTQQEPPLVMET